MGAYPILFTVEFRRKMAELSQDERKEWLRSLAAGMRSGKLQNDPVLEQALSEVARGCRLRLVDSVQRHLGPFDDLHLRALLEVPRERFVRAEEIDRSAEDTPLPLDSLGFATISAPHAYLLSYRLLGLRPGDFLVELGTGSGYGAALAGFIVGTRGRVLSFEIDSDLAAWAGRLIAEGTGTHNRNVAVIEGDAATSAPSWQGARKVVVAFAVDALAPAWLTALPEGGCLVAPVGPRDQDQRLVLATKRHGRVIESDHGAVRYVRNRSGV